MHGSPTPPLWQPNASKAAAEILARDLSAKARIIGGPSSPCTGSPIPYSGLRERRHRNLSEEEQSTRRRGAIARVGAPVRGHRARPHGCQGRATFACPNACPPRFAARGHAERSHMLRPTPARSLLFIVPS